MRSPARTHRRHAWRAVAATAAATLLAGCAAGGGAAPETAPAAPAGCRVDLIVAFAPYVAAPGSQAFVAELLAGSGYHLRYVRRLASGHVLRLTGPDATCEAGIALLRHEPRVQSVAVDERHYREMTQ